MKKDWFAALADQFWLKPDAEGAEEAAFIRRALRLRRGQRVLDAPCGAGRIAVHLAKAGGAVTGLDLRPQFIRRARRRFRRERRRGLFLVQDLRTLELAGEFDAVVNWHGSFGYFSDADNLSLARRFARALRPGGRLIVDAPNREYVLRHFQRDMMIRYGFRMRSRWDSRSQRCITRYFIGRRNDPQDFSSMRLYTPAQIRRLFAWAGLRVVRLYGSLAGEPYRRSSRRMIVVAQKRR